MGDMRMSPISVINMFKLILMNFNKYPEYLSCSGKRKYKTVLDASDAGRVQEYNNSYTVKLYIYECEYCKNFHLTQQKTEMPV